VSLKERQDEMPSDLCEEQATDCGVTEGCVTQKGKSVYTWQDLSKLNERHNAHIAVRGKVSISIATLCSF